MAVPAIPPIPTSPYVAGLHQSAANNGEIGFPDTIVVRGYLGPPTEDLARASQILGSHGLNGIPAQDIAAVAAGGQPGGHWRLYLSARHDCWIEIPSWDRCVAHCVSETSADRVDAYTVWLRTWVDEQRMRYRIVTVDELDPDHDSFVAGRLIHDYMTQSASRKVVWDEQQFGPTTGKVSTKYCF